MSYGGLNPNLPAPRHQPVRGARNRDMKPPTYQHRAQTGPGLMPPPGAPIFSNKPLAAQQHRVLLAPNQQPQYILHPTPPGVAGSSILRASAGMFVPPTAQLPPHMFPFQPQQQAAASMHFNTQQPIALGQALGQPVAQQQQQPGMGMAAQQHVRSMMPAVMYSQQDQPDPASVRKAIKSRSRAIKIVDPATLTEVKMGGESTSDKVTAAEFKSKVQSAAVEGNTAPIEGEEIVSGVSHRPNAIITKPEDGAVPVKEEDLGVAAVSENLVQGEVEQQVESKPQGGVALGVKEGEEKPDVVSEDNKGKGLSGGEDTSASSASSLPSSMSEVDAIPAPVSEVSEASLEGVEAIPAPVSEVSEASLEGAESGKELPADIAKRPSEETGQHEKVEEGCLVEELPATSQTELEVPPKEGVEPSEEDKVAEVDEGEEEGGEPGAEEEGVESDATPQSTASEEDANEQPGEVEDNWNAIASKLDSISGGKELDEDITEAESDSVVQLESDAMEEPNVGELEEAELEPEKLESGELELETLESGELELETLESGELEPEKLESGELESGELEPEKLEPGKLESGGEEPGKLESEGEEPEPEGLEPEELEPGELEPGELEPDEEEPTSALDSKLDAKIEESSSLGVPNIFPSIIVDSIPPDSAPPDPVTTNDKPRRDKRKSRTPPPAPKIGPDERMMYDREFLISFRESCRDKPKGLELFTLDLMHDGPIPRGIGSNSMKSRVVHAGGRRGSEPKRILHQPMAEKPVVLNKAEVRWTRPVARLTDVPEDTNQTDELYRKFQGILNKLTPQKFQSLAEQALKLEINTVERLSGCIDKIFTKALEEPSFSIAYANLCKVMSPIKVEVAQEEGKPAKITNFRRMLLTKCQQEFEKDKKDDETLEKMRDSIEQAASDEKQQEVLKKELSVTMIRMRKRSLGNIRFIGELFKLKMLSETIMHECITRLLKSSSDEEALECFGKLMMTTGKDLDKPEAKTRIDTYFKRMADIIKKGKVAVRIKFMLQDVQEMRDMNWVPRVRQDKQLKTIDQIHAEAKMEQEKEKEMIQQHQVISRGGGGGRDGRRGPKEEWHGKGDRSKENREIGEREKFDQKKVVGILSRHRGGKEKTGIQTSLGPNTTLRPTGWKQKGSAPVTSAPVDKSGKPLRSSSSGTKRLGPEGRGPSRGSISGPKRAQTTPEQEREAALQKVSQFMNPSPPPAAPSKDAPAQAVLRVDRKPAAPEPAADPALVSRKIISIIDELVNNSDFKEAVECVKPMAPHMDVVVTEGINHTLEKNTQSRVVTGKLFSKLVQEKVLTQQKFLAGLNEVLENAEDIAIDIPKIWSYLGEVLAPVMSHSTLSLSLLDSVPRSLVESRRAAKLVAEVLLQCRKVLGSEEAVKTLWIQSRLGWDALGMPEEDLGEFLADQGLSYLCEEVGGEVTEAPYEQELQQLLSTSDTNNKEISTWIKAKCSEIGSPLFSRNLTRTVVRASVTGSGTSAIFTRDLFEKRMEIVKEIHNSEHGLEVLNGLQVTVAQLSHPPKLLGDMFDIVYNTEVVSEDDLKKWREDGTELFGRGNAVMSVKSFFEWLQLDSEDAQNPT